MLIIMIDANVLVSDPLLRDSTWESIKEAQQAGRIRVLTPRLAVDEAVATYQRKRQATALEIKKVSRYTSKNVKASLETAMEEARDEGARYPKHLKAALKARGVEVVPTPKVNHDIVAGRAIARRRPFDDNGDGYRDTLHWYAFLGIVDELYEGHDIFFVSADRRAFGGPNEQDGEAGFHPDLKGDLEKYDAGYPWIRWFTSLRDVPVPGQFMEAVDGRALWVGKAEIAAHILDYLRTNDLDVDPRRLGLADSIADVLVLDLEDATTQDLTVQQYYDNAGLRITFVIRVEAELAARTVVDATGGSFIDEGRLEMPLFVSGVLETPGYEAPLGVPNIVDIRAEPLE
ncbi:hypothetical protein ASE16_03195 [Leifsonia sp. Root227]|uniref:PIN domain-containing protein n=1 Tax=Leifsonia sp. Root227 TaxID=1736496 RepID=UPI0006F7C468|nr:PIN domain-containing protein [Leifsonia sp. Root227]KRC52077.1 hypothetical protein ASE16_03195 [Leifsonia sp. Root227]